MLENKKAAEKITPRCRLTTGKRKQGVQMQTHSQPKPITDMEKAPSCLL